MTGAKKDSYLEAVGRRKTAIARVRVFPKQKGVFLVNNRAFKDYFSNIIDQLTVNKPLETAQLVDKFSITAKIVGGGCRAQAAALAHGLARALLLYDSAFKGNLRAAKLLTRDAREKERRKFGLKKARKAPQWSKR